MDFTLKKYEALLAALKDAGYDFLTYAEYCEGKGKERKFVILRHDVDKRPDFSHEMALVEKRMEVKSSYYFRCVDCSYNEVVMKDLERMGHEVGYHYEDLSLCKGDEKKALNHFENILKKMRQCVIVRTICMHGSPLSKFDNRNIWKNVDYRKYGIIGEPYFDTDWQNVLYKTDTGRRWDGEKFSVRDKIEKKEDAHHYVVHSTDDLIILIKKGMVDKMMLTTHPQRWTDKKFVWLKELLLQNVKNAIKFVIVR